MKLIEVKSPSGSCPFIPYGLAVATVSLKVCGTVVIGKAPTLAKLPDTTIFFDLNSETETSTCGLLRTLESFSVKSNLISSIVLSATSRMPALG